MISMNDAAYSALKCRACAANNLVKACVCNLSNMPFVVQPKDRIAQLVILPAPQLALTSIGALDDTDRSDGGFGSTGVK